MNYVYNKRGGMNSYPCWAVYIGRPSKWGNPFMLRPNSTPEERSLVIEKYKLWLTTHPELIAAAKRELRGKDLLCWCAPLACHGDVLLRIANEI